MTYEEAPYEEALHEISVMAHMETKDDISMRISKDCYKILVRSLEKQIPKNPVVKKIGDDIKLNYCPCCNVRFFRAGFKYCGECGQSLEWIDWSDGE